MNKECYTCKHERLEIDQEPCASCVKHSAWERNRKINCFSCRYQDTKEYEEPCMSCIKDNDFPNWEEARPRALPEIVPYYERESSRIPERIRVSFSDGSTAIYDLHMDQPAPIIIENIKIIRRMAGYTAPRPRRRNRK